MLWTERGSIEAEDQNYLCEYADVCLRAEYELTSNTQISYEEYRTERFSVPYADYWYAQDCVAKELERYEIVTSREWVAAFEEYIAINAESGFKTFHQNIVLPIVSGEANAL